MTSPTRRDPWDIPPSDVIDPACLEGLLDGPRPLDPDRPLLGCDLHGRYYWRRSCPGCPDPTVHADVYARLDADAHDAELDAAQDAREAGASW